LVRVQEGEQKKALTI